MATMFEDIARAAAERATHDPTFWATCARTVSWVNQPENAEHSAYPGGRLNLCFNALDRPVIFDDADRLALITPRVRWSVAELLDFTARAAGILLAGGVSIGDPVLLALPPNEHLVIAVLACSRVGVRPVLATAATADAAAVTAGEPVRLAIVAASRAEAARAAIAHLPAPPAHVLVIQDPEVQEQFGDSDLDWATAMRPDGVGAAGCEPLPSAAAFVGAGSHTVHTGYAAAVLSWGAREVLNIAPDSEWSMPDVTSDTDLAAAVHAPLLARATLRMS